MTQPEQAVLIWPVLALAAHMQRLLTYGEVEGLTGIAAQGQHTALGLIHAYCKHKGYPILNSIVVKAEGDARGLPGAGFPEQWTPVEHLLERSKVFAFDWRGKAKPRSADFT